MYQNKTGHTDRAGVVVKHANPSIWAGVVMQKIPKNTKNAEKANGDRPTDIADCTVASTRLKSHIFYGSGDKG